MLCWGLGSLSLCPRCYPSSPKSVKKKKGPESSSEETIAAVHAQSQAGELQVSHNSFFKITTVVVYACNFSIRTAQHRRKSEVSLGFIARTCLKGK